MNPTQAQWEHAQLWTKWPMDDMLWWPRIGADNHTIYYKKLFTLHILLSRIIHSLKFQHFHFRFHLDFISFLSYLLLVWTHRFNNIGVRYQRNSEGHCMSKCTYIWDCVKWQGVLAICHSQFHCRAFVWGSGGKKGVAFSLHSNTSASETDSQSATSPW